MTQSDSFDVVIIGGGLAGLSAAAHLADKGIAPLILEADSLWPGGRLSGGEPDRFTYEGRTWSFTPDHGVHAVWGGYENMRALLDRFTDTQLQPSLGEEWINRWGREVRRIEAGRAIRSRWIPAPFHYLQLLFHPHIWSTINPLDFLSLPGFLFSMLWAIGFDPIDEESALDGLEMKEFFRGWTPNLRATFEGLGVNLLAAPADKISLTAYISALRFYTVMRRDIWQMSYFPADSHTSLIAPICRSIEANGGKLLSGATAVELEQHDDGLRIIYEDSARGAVRSVWAQDVIIALNSPAAQRLLISSPSTQEAASNLIFPEAVRSASVRLWFDIAPETSSSGGMLTGDFMPDNFFWIHQLYPDCYAWFQDVGGSAVELHFYGPEELLDQPDNHLLIVAVDEIQRAFPELKRHFVHGVVRRNSRTHTRFRVPTSQSLHVNTPWESVWACGDWIGYKSPTMWMERSVVTSIAAANEVLRNHDTETYPIQNPPAPGILVVILAQMVKGLRWLLNPLILSLRFWRRRRRG